MRSFSLVVIALLILGTGCSSKAPPIHPVTGKVTWGGKGYSRLLVYFRPASGTVNHWGTNMAVGETDDQGNLKIMTTTGNGLQTGDYKVTFAYFEQVKGSKSITNSDKPDEQGVQTKQVMVPPYDDETSQATTPVSFSVVSGTNEFVFDIPK